MFAASDDFREYSTPSANRIFEKLSTPTNLFRTIESVVYAADRERDALLSRVKHGALGDPLSSLSPSRWVLQPGSATIAITGATDGVGKAAATWLAQAGFGVILCARDHRQGRRSARGVVAVDQRVG